jgi:nitroreductase
MSAAADHWTTPFTDVVRERRSVRGFLDRPVPQALLEKVFALAQQSPSNCNTQPWHTWVVSGARRDRLASALLEAGSRGEFSMDIPYNSQGYDGTYKARQHDAAARLYSAMGIERSDRERRTAAFLENYNFFGAPHAAFLFMPAWGNEREAADIGMYAQTLMLALTAHGLASCPQTALGMFAGPIKAELGIGPELKLLFGLSFGYEKAEAPANTTRIPRAELAETTRFVE